LAAVENRAAENQAAEGTARLTPDDIKVFRKEAAQRKRRLVVHSDGYPMNPEHRGLFEPNARPSLFPQLPGTHTDACTYSLIHQFPVARLYRSNVAQQWVEYALLPATVRKGPNRVVISRGPGAQRNPVVRDLQLSIRYHPCLGSPCATALGLDNASSLNEKEGHRDW
jgi:hypothetical protein